MKQINDQKQREQALDISASFIVQAPAGSGKTELLTQRFLVLLAHVKQPEEILAITFTKKSAAEMRARIINALRSAQINPEPEATHAKNTWNLAKKVLKNSEIHEWNVMKNPNRLKIQTIDAFNAYITRQLPILSHFGATPSITDHADKLYREAILEFLSHLEEEVAWSDAIALLLLHLDNDMSKLELLLIHMLAKRDQWLPYITLNATEPDLRNKLEHHLSSVSRDIITSLQVLFPSHLREELISMASFAANNLKETHTESPILACTDYPHAGGEEHRDAKNKSYWLGIAELLLTKDFNWRKKLDKNLGFPAPSDSKDTLEKARYKAFKERMAVLLNELESHEDLRITLEELCLSPHTSYDENQWQVLQALHQVLRIVVAQLKLVFQKYGEIDYIENAQGALAALGSDDAPTDMTLALDYQIKHILIDEFQDTSQSQFRLIEKLTAGWENNDGRTLFLVGDPMQSIYRFREAEVGLFIRARQHGLGNIKLIPLTLNVNFRSTPEIVDWVNQTFDSSFPNYEDIAMGAVKYSPSTTMTEKNDASYVLLHPASSEPNEQGKNIVKLIQATQQEKPNDTIAILVRSRTHLTDVIQQLKAANLSYRAIDIDPLDSRPVIQDLLSLTRGMHHLADRVAWLAMLRAPWCGLTLADLLTIAGHLPHLCLWERLQHKETIKQLSEDGQRRIARILPILKNSLADRNRYALRSWIEKTWLLLGGPAAVNQESDLTDAKAYFNLLDSLDKEGKPLDLNELNEKMKKLYAEPNPHSDQSLQIMTIHNAKGLEFDTVILPHLERKPPNDDKQLLHWMERPQQNDTSALILAPISAAGKKTDRIYDYIKRQLAIKNDHERVRLLYVAATRAKKQLHLFFSVNYDDEKTLLKPQSSSLLEKCWLAIENNVKKICSIHDIDQQNETAHDPLKTTRTKIMHRLEREWVNPISLSIPTTISHHHKNGFSLIDTTATLTGTIIHQMLQYLSHAGVSWWHAMDDTTKNQFIQKRLIQAGLRHNKIGIAHKQVMKAINNTLNDQRGQWILTPHSRAKSEFKITVNSDNKPTTYILDRTFIDENGVRWIIDYKSSAPEAETITDFLKKEYEKYEKQLKSYANSLFLMEQRPTKIGLYFPLVPAWYEQTVDEATPIKDAIEAN